MLHKKRKSERLRKDIGRNVAGGNAISTKGTIGNKATNKMMSNVNMFRTRSDRRIVGKSASTLIIRKKRERMRNRKKM